MFLELKKKETLEQAKDYAFDYLNKALERSPFPSNEAIINLKNFEEPFPKSTGDSKNILEHLNRYGADATVV
ncbi:MAG TPA: aspartate aminotransferase family protein, partial [Gammaproteobacteria bacterium]|nr:aspartate aminotransferase family protein [Gammaproteobacteria bacterium]